jgi:glyceraldehyde-3-phosphate dehydrogenase (NADP+)
VELFLEAGVPPDALHVLPVSNDQAAEMVRDPRIAVLSFTGSAAVGWKLKQSTAAKGVLLELGGNAGVLVEPDADLAYAAQRIAIGAFAYSGQVCISVQRIFVHRAIRDAFVDHLIQALEHLEAAQLLCPLIQEQSAQRVDMWVKEALNRGARMIFQQAYTLEGKGVSVRILEGVPHDLPLWNEEVFGPVALIETYDRLEEALRQVNESRYGLHAGLFTRDIQRIWEAFEDLDVGGLVINDVPTYRADPMPYGGSKASGLLREGPRYAMEAYTEPRALILNRPAS